MEKELRILLSLLFCLSLGTFAYTAKPAKADVDAEEIAAIIAEAEAEGDAEEGLEETLKELEDPTFLHQIMHQREMGLEKIEAFNNTNLLTLHNFGTVKQFHWHPEGRVEQKEIKLGIFVKHLLQPALHYSSVLFDSHSIGEYFDGIIEIMADAIIQKRDVVLYNLDIMLNTEDENLFASSFKNLDENLQKTMNTNRKRDKLSIAFFKKRIAPALLEHARKSLRSPAFILPFNRSPKGDAKDDPEQEIQVIPFDEHIVVANILNPLIKAFSDPLDIKINEWVSGYKDERPTSIMTLGWEGVKGYWSSFFPHATHSILEMLLEFTKQIGLTKPVDEALWFTLSTEVVFNLYFFRYHVKNAADDILLDLFIKEGIGLRDLIYKFERQLKNATADKQAVLTSEFKEQVYTTVLRHFGKQQPIVFEKLRKKHISFNSLVIAGLLAPITIDLCKLAWPIAKHLAK